ncbi:uncharacterized protein CLUP02_01941 [Colletotrichum lupini]|uniref:Uncharacterized protein n=1 Tax=Colletotrichum lupini TaxID=145971 RepID=A0A9Q8SEZ1_9PEZI|nr:uncharacterized protein CLUP02_01941 [Colletotrichum lupini]UQC75287.1 hypothetical protein CLUP02_01941 [Colletotrichum lupini]
MPNGAGPPICTVETLRVRYRNGLKAFVGSDNNRGARRRGVPEGRATVISCGDWWERVITGRLFGKFLVPPECTEMNIEFGRGCLLSGIGGVQLAKLKVESIVLATKAWPTGSTATGLSQLTLSGFQLPQSLWLSRDIQRSQVRALLGTFLFGFATIYYPTHHLSPELKYLSINRWSGGLAVYVDNTKTEPSLQRKDIYFYLTFYLVRETIQCVFPFFLLWFSDQPIQPLPSRLALKTTTQNLQPAKQHLRNALCTTPSSNVERKTTDNFIQVQPNPQDQSSG